MKKNPEQILQLLTSPWYYGGLTDNLERFADLERGVFQENDKIVGIRIDNLLPPLTQGEVLELLKFYARDLKYLGLGGTIDCSVIKQIDLKNISHLWLGSSSIKYLDGYMEKFPNSLFLKRCTRLFLSINFNIKNFQLH